MSERRRGLGRGLGALIPPAQAGGARPTDVFWPEATPVRSTAEESTSPDVTRGTSAGVDGEAGSTGAIDGRQTTQPDGAENRRPSAGGRSRADDVDGHGLAEVPGATYAEVPLDAIRPNPRQPRTVFDEDELAELVHSIREIGVLQPVVVRPIEPVGEVRFELIMGERRWRASRDAGKDTVPAIVKVTDDDNLLRDALLENLHRSNLNPLEEAAAYQQLLDDFGCTQEHLATRIGRSRPQISNTLRLLKLPPLVARRVAAGVLSAGHARALLTLDDGASMERLAQRIVAEGLSVRTVEEIVALGGDATPPAPRQSGPRPASPELEDLASRLSDRLDTRAKIQMGQRKGRVTIEFATVEDLHRIITQMGVTLND